ncbi:hypothetical protein ATY79_22180 [Rhizobium sp. R693]|nr:hypothetical protein ATY79_22180 [Rhizobium sp. R693]
MPDAAEVRDQLRRIMESPDFDATDRTRRFLAYIVEETLAGRSERIKAYAIATQVFGRDATFDAHSDPIVRIEAGHLRRTLDRFYLTAGASELSSSLCRRAAMSRSLRRAVYGSKPLLEASRYDGSARLRLQ